MLLVLTFLLGDKLGKEEKERSGQSQQTMKMTHNSLDKLAFSMKAYALSLRDGISYMKS